MIFGPWIGEFSYELLYWLPRLRSLTQEYPGPHTMYGYSGRQALYRGICDHYLVMSPELEGVLEEPYGPFCHVSSDVLFEEYFKTDRERLGLNLEDMYDPSVELQTISDIRDPQGVTFDFLRAADVAVHQRDTLLQMRGIDKYWSLFPRMKRPASDPGQQIFKSMWSEEKWIELVEVLYAQHGIPCVVSGIRSRKGYGGVSLSNYTSKACYSFVDECSELEEGRGLDLQIALYQGASFSFGTRGGAGILAMLCNCPALMLVDVQHFKRFKIWQKWFGLKQTSFIRVSNNQIREYPVKDFQERIGVFWRKLCEEEKNT